MSRKIATSSRFCATYMYFLDRFGVRMLANTQQRLNSQTSRFLEEYWETLTAKSRKRQTFYRLLIVSVSFHVRSESFG